MKREDVRFDSFCTEDAQLVLVAFGSMSRVSRTAVELARTEGMKVGLFRPITLFPYPERALFGLSQVVKSFLTVELNTGQMVEDVRLSVDRNANVYFYGKPPGALPTPEEVLEEIKKYYT